MSMDMNMNVNTGLDEEKIKGILNAAIKNKEDKIKQIKNDIIFLNKQREQGMIDTFTNIENIDSDSVSAQKLGLAVIAIIYDILTGVGDAVNRIRADAKSRGIQKGGGKEIERNRSLPIENRGNGRPVTLPQAIDYESRELIRKIVLYIRVNIQACNYTTMPLLLW